MIPRRTLTLTFLLLVLAPGITAGQDQLAAAKDLYASASYEAALEALSAAAKPETADQVDQYRALCLLALGRTPEAERAVEQLVTRRPHARISDADTSPRLAALFHEVRRRLLPAAAKADYVAARATFAEKRYGAAISQIKNLLALLADPDLAETDELDDLRLLAEGFMQLAEAELAAAQVALSARPPAPVGPVAPPKPVVYSASSPDVTPPVELERPMPNWTLRGAAPLPGALEGQLEIVINEQGAVESAVLRDPVAPFYDQALLRAARTWQYRPAMREGKPVKFLKAMDIVLRPE